MENPLNSLPGPGNNWHIYGQLNFYSHEECPVGADCTSSNISWVSLRPNVYSIYESIV